MVENLTFAEIVSSKENYTAWLEEVRGVQESDIELRVQDIEYFENLGLTFNEAYLRCRDMPYGFTQADWFLNLSEDEQKTKYFPRHLLTG